MTDAQFFKSFSFQIFQYKQYHLTDVMKNPGCPMHYFGRMITGSARLCTADFTLHLQPGDAFYLPKGLFYQSHWYPEENRPVRFYSFGFDCFPADEHTTYRLQQIACTKEAWRYLAELESDIAVSPLSIGRLYRFLGEVHPCLQPETNSKSTVLLSKALEYMRQSSHFAVGDVARHCGISESALFGQFRRHLGKTPVEAHRRILADKAGELLATTDLSVEEISDRLGFSSSAYFRKVFRGQTGQTPTEFRKNNRRI